MRYAPESLQLQLPGFSYADLFQPHKLAELTELFVASLRRADPSLAAKLATYHANQGIGMSDQETSDLLVRTAPYLSEFIATVFGIWNARETTRQRAEQDMVVMKFKKEFFVRRILKKYTSESVARLDTELLDKQMAALRAAFLGISHDDPELATALIVAELLQHERFAKTSLPAASAQFAARLVQQLHGVDVFKDVLSNVAGGDNLTKVLTGITTIVEQWVAGLYFRRDVRAGSWATFKVPAQIDFAHLVDGERLPGSESIVGKMCRRRDGFDLTDARYSEREVMGEVDYCIFCHERDKDSCSKGFPEPGGYKKNPLGFSLKGCPLDQKISESQLLMSSGDSLAALAVIAVDNPMLPGTGHRICNDCMKSCIYQKQDPVNIPQIETGILMDVLHMPWGFEIYSLLTRWNPLHVKRPHALPYNGINILVVGMGPAGYTLAHYLLNEGFGVVGIDGLKIEPLPPELVGDENTPPHPVRDFSSISSKLSERMLAGFGGVSEYGITVRWDKNFLSVIYLNLVRREYFRVYGGVRFGGTVTVEDAWAYGFDHVCLATGAGKPTFVKMKNSVIRGIRMASDFLMALQLTGAGKTDAMANLQVQLPAIVIGGGLTAIDTATELMAYYPVQVSKVKRWFDVLVKHYGRSVIERMFDPEETGRLNIFLQHATEIDAERNRAASSREKPNFIPLLRQWGGVHIYYRKTLIDSPAYRLNHEEIIKSLEEGIAFVERMKPIEAVSDESGAVSEMVFERMDMIDGKWINTGKISHVPARTVMIAAGTVPNVMYEREHPGTFSLDVRDEFFSSYTRRQDDGVHLARPEATESGFFTSYEKVGHLVSFYGDNHPEFAGNVVKAMASAKEGHRAIVELFRERLSIARLKPADVEPALWDTFVRRLDRDLMATVVRVNRLTPSITEVVVQAPKAAREFRPGQFFRLQNYEVDAPRMEGTLVLMEGIALTGAWVDRDRGRIGLITLEVGASSKMCALLKPGQRVVVMGPTGAPTEIPSDTTVLLLGGGLGNAVLFSIAGECRKRRNKVIYFAGYKKKDDFFMRDEIESSADVVVYSVDSGEQIPVLRPQDRTFRGNIVEAIVAYAEEKLGPASIPLSDARRVIAIGSDRMMAAVTQARHEVLKPYLQAAHTGIVSINSPMQCMMKAICAQCLQRQVDPKTGIESIVFSCVNQDQPMDHVDFANLNARLRVNSVMEKLTNKWFEYLVETHSLDRI